MPHSEAIDEATLQELRAVLDEEIGRLAEKYQAPIVLCYFEGKSYERAAKELGWSKSTLANRLTRARELLREQLVRRGITLSAAALAAALAENVRSAPIGAMLTINTVKAVLGVVAGKAVAGGISATAVALAEEAMKSMAAVKATLILALLALTVGGAGLAANGWSRQSGAACGFALPATPAAHAPQSNSPPQPKPKIDPPVDLFGDPLPDGAMARLGTVRFRQGITIRSIAFAPDGKTLASTGGGGAGSLCLWNPTDGKAIYRLQGRIQFLAYSPDSKTLATTGDKLRLFDVATGKQLLTLAKPLGSNAGPLAFSPDGKMVATAELEGAQVALVLWDPSTGKEIRRCSGHAEDLSSIAFSPDGKTVASASEDKAVCLWETATGKELARFEGQPGELNRVVFSPDGNYLASLGDKAAIQLWDATATKQLRNLQAGGRTILHFAFSPDGTQLASTEIGGLVRIWEPNTGKEIRNWMATPTSNYALAYSPHNYPLAYSPDGKTLATSGAADHAIQLWDPATGMAINPPKGHTSHVDFVRLTPDGKTLFAHGLEDKRVLEWDVISGRERRELFAVPQLSGDTIVRPWLFDLSPDGKLLAWTRHVGGPLKRDPVIKDPVIRLWDTSSGKEIRTFNLADETVWHKNILFSPDAKFLAARDEKGITVWEVATGKVLHRLQNKLPDDDYPMPLAFSPDSRLLAFGDDTKTIFMYDVSRQARKSAIGRIGTRTFSICCFHPTASPSLPCQVAKEKAFLCGQLIWGRSCSISGGTGFVFSLRFSPDGHMAAASVAGEKHLENGDRVRVSTIYLWDILTRQEIRQIDSPQGRNKAMAYTAEGRTLATGGADSTILLWDLTGHAENGKYQSDDLTAKDLNKLWSDLAAIRN